MLCCATVRCIMLSCASNADDDKRPELSDEGDAMEERDVQDWNVRWGGCAKVRFMVQRLAFLLCVVGVMALAARPAVVSAAHTAGGGGRGGLVDPAALNPASSHVHLGSVAPDFTLRTIDGVPYTLSRLRGRAVLLDFVAVWCPHCQREEPILNRIDATFAPTGVRSLSIVASPYGRDYESGDTRVVNLSDIAWYQTTFQVRRPILIDPVFSAVNRYGIAAYPTIYILDRNGVVRAVFEGDTSEQTLRRVLTHV